MSFLRLRASRRMPACVVLVSCALALPVPAHAKGHSATATHKAAHAARAQPAQVGTASWYGREHAGRPTASGATFDPDRLTAAHRSLPLGTQVRVTHLASGRSVVVTINDRGPYIRGRIIDLSRQAADQLGMAVDGVAKVRLDLM